MSCICGQEPRVACLKCGRYVKIAVVKGEDQVSVHEVVHCTGSHLEYKTCSGSSAKVSTLTNMQRTYVARR